MKHTKGKLKSTLKENVSGNYSQTEQGEQPCPYRYTSDNKKQNTADGI